MSRTAILAAALAATAAAAPAHAAFPGANGKVAFQRNQSPGTDQVHVANADGSGRVQVTRPQHYFGGTDGFIQPSFSPDGTRLVVLSQSGGRPWTVYANAAQLKRIDGALNEQWSAEQPHWTTDGRIVFGVIDGTDPMNPVYRGIHSVRASDGGDLRQLTHGVDFDATPSPDGSRLAFVRRVSEENGGTGALMVANADGSNPVAVHTAAGDDFPMSPDWSPDSQTIVFDRSQKGIASVLAGGGEVRTVTPKCLDPGTGCGWDSQPVFSPDGTKILFGRVTPGKVGESNTLTLHTVAPDGLSAASVAFAGSTDSGPSWGVHTTAQLPEPEPDATSGKPNTDGPGGIAPAGGGTTTTTTTTTENGVGVDARLLTLRGRGALPAFFSRRGLQVPVGVSVAGTLRLEAYAGTKKVGAGRASARRAGIVIVKLKATVAARRLRGARSLKLRVRGSFRTAGGQKVALRAKRVTLTR